MILVIGGDGFIGRNLIKSLILKNKKIKILKRNNKKKYFNHENIQYFKGDLRNYSSLLRASKGVKVIINLAGIANISYCENNIDEAFEINSFAVVNILKILKFNKKIKFIQASSSEVYGNVSSGLVKETNITKPYNVYGYSKLIAEKLIYEFSKKYERHIYVLRFFNIYASDQDKSTLASEILNFLKNNKNIKLRNGSIKRDFLFIDDIVSSILFFINQKKKIYDVVNICSGKSISIRTFAKKILKYSKSKLKINKSKYKKTHNFNIRGSNDKLLKVYGFKIKFNIDKGIKAILYER